MAEHIDGKEVEDYTIDKKKERGSRMKMKKVILPHGFNLFIHPKCSVFIDTDNSDHYLLMDWDGDAVCMIFVSQERIEIKNSRYDLHHTINFISRSVTFHLRPDDEEVQTH